eukprot:8316-Heterococcus_DN1.PRE.3
MPGANAAVALLAQALWRSLAQLPQGDVLRPNSSNTQVQSGIRTRQPLLAFSRSSYLEIQQPLSFRSHRCTQLVLCLKYAGAVARTVVVVARAICCCDALRWQPGTR